MADQPVLPTTEAVAPGAAPAAPVPPRRSPGHRGADVKDTVAEMTAKAHEISLEAGSKMAAAMKDVINAAAGITEFVLASARDLVQYMVRRGQMTQDEADKLMRQAEEAQGARRPSGSVAEERPKAPASGPVAERGETRSVEPPRDRAPAAAVPKPAATPAAPRKAAASSKGAEPVARGSKPAVKRPVKPTARPAPKSAGKAVARKTKSKPGARKR